ncbi:hypothetical protein C8Q80DRAFT_1272828 [Daedaleopsis nitida]|nr:hypothetical protein C8Q80DRAFT_1272828 [Daedaleopsis nitida]
MTTPAPQTSSSPTAGMLSQTSHPSQSQSPAISTETAPSPFDKAGADIILRTSDMVNFYVYSHVLILASPFFETISPAIAVPEDSVTLDVLLRICYPFKKQDSDYSLATLEATWKAAVKYEMELPIQELTKKLLIAAATSPVAAWAVASRVGLESLARRAAERMLKLKPSVTVTESDIIGVTAADLYRLREFRRQNGRVPTGFRLLTASTTTTSGGNAQHTSIISSDSFSEHAMPYTDLVCHASDGVTLHVHRGVISAASTVLHQKIQHLSPEVPAEKAELELQEDSTVLSALFSLCYPASDALPRLPTDLWISVLEAARRYEMEGICKTIQLREMKGVDALSVYLIAARMGRKAIAQEAALRTLSDPLSEIPPNHYSASMAGESNIAIPPLYSHFMELTPALVYLYLIRYHEAYLIAMQDVFRRAGFDFGQLTEVLHKATFLPSDDISFTLHALIQACRVTSNSGYHGSSGRVDNLRQALEEVPERMKEVSVANFVSPLGFVTDDA